MLRLLEHVSNTYSPRFYIMADTDKMSEEKITKFEKQEPQGKKAKVNKSQVFNYTGIG